MALTVANRWNYAASGWGFYLLHAYIKRVGRTTFTVQDAIGKTHDGVGLTVNLMTISLFRLDVGRNGFAKMLRGIGWVNGKFTGLLK